MLTALWRERVELCVAAGLRGLPFRLQPAAILQAVERRVERPLLELEELAGDLPHPLGDGVAMNRPQRHHLQDEHVERSPQKLGFLLIHKTPMVPTYTPQQTQCQEGVAGCGYV